MSQLDALVRSIRDKLGDLNDVHPDAEYEYSSLGLCVIDAVFSIGARYESTERTVRDFSDRFGWALARDAGPEHATTEFLDILAPYDNRWEQLAIEVFRNRQRTSARSGILKAEAVFRFATALRQFNIETFADAHASGLNPELRRAISCIPGQGSGLSYNYFLLLAGNTNAVKADRMVRRLVADAIGSRSVSNEDCERLVREATAVLRAEFPALTPSKLDHAIWRYQRKVESPPTRCRPAMAGS
jgi:hypothetical protein